MKSISNLISLGKYSDNLPEEKTTFQKIDICIKISSVSGQIGQDDRDMLIVLIAHEDI